MAKQRAMGTELEAFNVAKKYNKTPSDRAKQLAYERVSFKAVEPWSNYVGKQN